MLMITSSPCSIKSKANVYSVEVRSSLINRSNVDTVHDVVSTRNEHLSVLNICSLAKSVGVKNYVNKCLMLMEGNANAAASVTSNF